MKFLLPILCLIPISTFAEEWKPPANPDPQTILSEAQADARAKRVHGVVNAATDATGPTGRRVPRPRRKGLETVRLRRAAMTSRAGAS